MNPARWLALLLLCSTTLFACSDEEEQPTPDADSASDAGVDAGSGPSQDAYDVWREMQVTLRASPDHLPGRAATLVAAKDAAGLHLLVRDDVALLPPAPDSFFDAANVVRWGPRATLRGASGTPRERAELLRWLYEQAGLSASVVVGTAESGADYAGLLARSPQRRIAYAIDDPTLSRWQAVLGGEPVEPTGGFVTALDPNHTTRDAILAQVRPLLTAPAPTPALATAATLIPLVRVTVDGQERFANPNVADAAFGDKRTSDDPVAADPPVGERALTLRLSASRSDRPNQPFLLLEKTWSASEVAGRNVSVAFTTPLPFAAAQKNQVGDASLFIPIMSVRGDGLDSAAGVALSAVGTPVTLGGETIEILPNNGGVVIDGENIAPGPTSPARLAEVTSLSATARGEAFADVELLLSARRNDSSSVPDLASDAFVVEEEGEPVAAQLRRTESPPPRLLLLFDRSSSIPTEFLDQAAEVGHAIATEVLTAFPEGEIRVAGLSVNGPEYAGPFTSSTLDVDAQLVALNGLGSEVWANLAAIAREPRTNLVVLISDMAAEDLPDPETLGLIFSGPPVLVAGVGVVNTATASQIATLSDGRLLTGVTPTNLAGLVRTFLEERRALDYRLVYRAPVTGPSERHVKVSMAAPSTVFAETSYTVPAQAVTAAGLSMLTLTIESGGRAVTRTIAGSAAGTAGDREAVNAALFGRTLVAVEAGPPSLSILFDEHIGERLAFEARYDALKSGENDAIVAAGKKSTFRLPSALRFSQAPLQGEEEAADLTFTDGLRVALHFTLPRFGRPSLERLDLLPLIPRRTLRPAGGDEFTPTLERSAELAVAEREHFAVSAAGQLEGETLALFDPLTIDIALGPAWREPVSAFADYEILAPADGSPVAFYAVHSQTGELIGGLADGSGGGIGRQQQAIGEGESTAQLVDRLLSILDAAKRVGEALGYEGVAAWASLEQTKVVLLGDVIMLFEGRAGGTSPGAQAQNDLCAAGLNAVLGGIPGWNSGGMPFADLQALYRYVRTLFGAETPDMIPGLNGPAAAACAAALGG